MVYRHLLAVTLLVFSVSILGLGISESMVDKPRLISAIPLSQTVVQLKFDRKLDGESARKVSNYQIDKGIQIQATALDARMNIVHLYTTPLEVNKKYVLTIQGVQALGTPPNIIDPLKGVPITLAKTMEVTFGEGDAVTLSGVLQDTSLIVDSKKKMKNYNAGGEDFLLCTPLGGVFFVAFEVMEIFEKIGITQPEQLLETSISLYAESVENDKPQQVILRRVLLPWKEGKQKSQPAEENELTHNSALHQNLSWNKPPAQAMLEGVNGDEEEDYNGSEDVADRIDGMTTLQGAGTRYVWKGPLVTDAFRFWLANPDYHYGYLFALRDGNASVRFASKENPDATRRPVLTIRYTTSAIAPTD